MRIRFPWNAAILATAGLLMACEQDSPTPEALCKRASTCEPMDLLLSHDTCAQQVRARLVNAPPACSECVLGLPCAGMARVASGKVSLAQICPSCPSSVTGQTDSCTAPHVLICGIAARPPAPASAVGGGDSVGVGVGDPLRGLVGLDRRVEATAARAHPGAAAHRAEAADGPGAGVPAVSASHRLGRDGCVPSCAPCTGEGDRT